MAHHHARVSDHENGDVQVRLIQRGPVGALDHQEIQILRPVRRTDESAGRRPDCGVQRRGQVVGKRARLSRGGAADALDPYDSSTAGAAQHHRLCRRLEQASGQRAQLAAPGEAEHDEVASAEGGGYAFDVTAFEHLPGGVDAVS